MTTDDRARTALHEALDGAVGSDAADTVMGYLPPVGWADVATKRDLDALAALRRKDLEETAAMLHTEIAALRHEMHTGITALRHEMHTGITALRHEMHTEITALRHEMHTEITALRQELHTGVDSLRHGFERSLKQMAMWVSSAVIGSAGLAVALNQLLG
jgi:flagellar biosynthesis/type III secretory pathway protein FliH